MKQKGKRFYVEEKTKKEKPERKEKKPVTDKQDLADAQTKAFKKIDTQTPDDKKDKQEKIIPISKHEKRKKFKQEKKQKQHKPVYTPKSDKRKVLSYEDLPLDDSGSTRFEKILRSIKLNKKSIILSVIIIVVLALSVLVFANRDRLTFSNIKNWVEYGVLNSNSEEQFPVTTEGAVITNGNFSRIDSNLVFASDTHFKTLNSYGRVIYSSPQSFSSPVLTQADDCDLSLVYNLGGTSFNINTLDSTIYSGTAEDNIIVADISKSGVYALVTEKDGYLSKLYVYSADNKQIFAYSFADYYITSVSLDSKGESAVLSGVSAHNGTQISSVYLLDFTEEEPVVFEEFENDIMYYVEHLTNNYVCVIGESAVYTLNSRTKSFNITEYEGKTLTAFDVNTDTNTFTLSLSRSGDGRMCDILSFSTSGALKYTINTELMVTSVSTYKNRVAALSSDTVYLYTKDGSLISTTDAGLEPHCIELYTTTDAYVLGVSEIRRIDL